MTVTGPVEARKNVALRSAMLLFWKQGVERTAYPDLVKFTGLSRKALYNFWPDKDALVAESLKAYDEAVLKNLRDALLPPGEAALARFWNMLEQGVALPGWNGCLLFRTAGTPDCGPTAKELLLQHCDILQKRFMQILMIARTGKDSGFRGEPNLAAAVLVAQLGQLSLVGSLEGNSRRAREILASCRRLSGLSG